MHCGQYDTAAAHAKRADFTARRHDSDDGQTVVLDLTPTAQHLSGRDLAAIPFTSGSLLDSRSVGA
jgi:hypothetical protein